MWYDTWLETLMGGVTAIRDHLPTIGAAVLLLVAGWVMASLGRRWSRGLAERLLDRLGAASSSIGKAVESSGARGNTPAIVATFVFWLILLVFLAAAVEILGLPVMTDLFGRLAAFAPNLLGAFLISLGGLIAAPVVRSAAMRAAEAGGVPQAQGIASVAEIAVIALASVIALGQLGVNGRVLELTIVVTVGSGLGAVALAFALGARASVANIIAAHYVARTFQIGQDLVIDDIRGTVLELTPTAVILRTRDGRVVVPAKRFHDTSTAILTREV